MLISGSAASPSQTAIRRSTHRMSVPLSASVIIPRASNYFHVACDRACAQHLRLPQIDTRGYPRRAASRPRVLDQAEGIRWRAARLHDSPTPSLIDFPRGRAGRADRCRKPSGSKWGAELPECLQQRGERGLWQRVSLGVPAHAVHHREKHACIGSGPPPPGPDSPLRSPIKLTPRTRSARTAPDPFDKTETRLQTARGVDYGRFLLSNPYDSAAWTGFARPERQFPWGLIAPGNFQTVNHRLSLKSVCRLPEGFFAGGVRLSPDHCGRGAVGKVERVAAISGRDSLGPRSRSMRICSPPSPCASQPDRAAGPDRRTHRRDRPLALAGPSCASLRRMPRR